jgi:hypothetical protein
LTDVSEAAVDSIEKYIFPAVVALISWLIKDFLFGLNVKRSDVLRREWEFRLRDVWSPLYFWSGIVLFDGTKKGWDKHGVTEFERILARSTHLIPLRHFYTFIRMLETVSGQNTSKLSIKEIQNARNFVYNQIEVMNYLLYRRHGLDDVSAKTNVLHRYQQLGRLLVLGVVHLTIWLFIVGLIFGVYTLYTHRHFLLLALIALVIVILLALFSIVDLRTRKSIEKEIRRRVGAE